MQSAILTIIFCMQLWDRKFQNLAEEASNIIRHDVSKLLINCEEAGDQCKELLDIHVLWTRHAGYRWPVDGSVEDK